MTTNGGMKSGNISKKQLMQINSDLSKPLNSLATEQYNSIVANTDYYFKNQGIKSIQRGFGSDTSSVTVTFSSINLSKSFITVTSTAPPSGNIVGVSVIDLKSTSMRIILGGTNNTRCNFYWQVIEFY